jgi:hypothetical protein
VIQVGINLSTNNDYNTTPSAILHVRNRIPATGSIVDVPVAIFDGISSQTADIVDFQLSGSTVASVSKTGAIMATSLQVAASTNATSTVIIGKTGQNKGSCLELFDSAGTPVYAYVAAGASTFTLSATSCQ